ncbi:hypothetical protein SSP531S_37810 [Streptomyces spongiicola]|uniref:DUF309 domain-containing protein n=1 Tax=Streptomyces spongiicola TaxID=1690221 RepID=A0A388T076_9ACTN|nr:hypothetical protein SSP531S_37810 [Streptomyces spongiicola]
MGRPLPYGAEGVDRQPEGVVRSPAETLAEAQRLLDAGMPFHAHEVLEDAWKSGPDEERGLWRGLAQLAVGLTHAARGNAAGGAALLARGAESIAPYGAGGPHGIEGPHGAEEPHGAEGPHGAEEPHGVEGPHGAEEPHGVEGPHGAEGPHGVDVAGLACWAAALRDDLREDGGPVPAAARAPRLRTG